jgi:hypothetical protein
VIVAAVAVAAIGAGLLAWAVARGGPPRVGKQVPVTPMDLEKGPANNSPALVRDPTESRFLVVANRLDAPDFSCALQVSGDGGRTWTAANPVPTLPPGAEKCYAPEAAFDRTGRLYYLFVGLAGAGNRPMGAFLTTSVDRAHTFSPPHQVLGSSNFGVRMGIDPTLGKKGRIHLVWLHAGAEPVFGGFAPVPNPILSAYSDDGGTTFTDPVQVSDSERARVLAPALALGPHHRVEVAYYDIGDDARDYQGLEGPAWDGTWSIVATTSQDGGAHYGRGTVVDDGIVPRSRIMLVFTMPPPALVSLGSRMCVAWTDARHGDNDVLIRCSLAGQGWAKLRRLNDDPVGDGRDQYLPRLAVSPGGRLDAIFFDRRNDPGNNATAVSYTYSLNGGRTFAGNVTLTTDSSSASIGQQYAVISAQGQVEFGSRLGLLSSRTTILAAWPDTRNSEEGTTDQDLFSTTVSLPNGGKPVGGQGVAGALLVVAGLGGIAAMAARARRRRRRPDQPQAEVAAAGANSAAASGDTDASGSSPQ